MYEGVLEEENSIRAFLQRAVEVVRRLAGENRFQRAPILLSGAGSAWYDVVAEVFSAAGFGDAVEIVLRPGCYLTHDVGAYRAAQAKILERNPIAHQMRSGLLPRSRSGRTCNRCPNLERRLSAWASGMPPSIQAFLHLRFISGQRSNRSSGSCALDADEDDGPARVYGNRCEG